MDNVERSLSTSKNTCRGTRALREKGRAKGVRRGASRRTYFPGARLAPWQFCHACFSPRFMPAHPRLTMSLASYTVIIAPPPRFPVHRLLPRKLSSPITGVWPFFGICAMLIRKFLPLPRIFFSFPAESTFPTRRTYPLPLFSPR